MASISASFVQAMRSLLRHVETTLQQPSGVRLVDLHLNEDTTEEDQ